MRQDQALYIMNQGKSVFLTGPAGSGKTYVLNQLISNLKKQGKEVAVTASTGIAATHIGGMTIHSWSGLGIRDRLQAQDKNWLLTNTKLLKRYNMTDVLIIDEISMLHGSRLDMINEVCKLLSQSSQPFGGMQVILTGDLFQLPPVSRGSNSVDFAHTSAAWNELSPSICYLTTQFRQKEGDLLKILEALRSNSLEEWHTNLLQERLATGLEPDASLTRLYTHNINVDTINNEKLQQLNEESHFYEMETSGRAQFVEQLQKSVLAPIDLELKIGAEVMFVANNFAAGFANGTRGRVVDFEDSYPLVELQSNRRLVKVEPYTWRYEEDGNERAAVSQLPLRLAWAITIHKSQGMSLDSALIDLSKAFTYGMGYVALSRVRSLEGLYLTGLNQMALRLHPEIYTFDAHIKSASEQLAVGITDELITKEEEADSKAEVQAAANYIAVYDRLKKWRAERSSNDNLPAYIIAHDATLEDIARRMPRSEAQLLAVNGFGPKKLSLYGPEILHITKSL